MLILSRKRGQSIMIGDDVEIHVVDIGGGKVRLGVTGPAYVSVHQRERYEAKRHVQPERIEAVAGSVSAG